MIKRNCNYCGKEYLTPAYPFKKGQGRFCSLKCSKQITPEETRQKMSNSAKKADHGKLFRGVPKSELHRLHLSLAKKGKPTKVHYLKGHIPWNKNKHRTDICGDKHPCWKGGVTPLNHKIRKSFEYQLWRTAVFERDNYTCIWCGAKCGDGKNVILNADHIKPFSLFPELRFAIDNGRTLCRDCHRTTETWGEKLTIHNKAESEATDKA
jgi:5-methylcytosine-specific restriction endonuclease McrA